MLGCLCSTVSSFITKENKLVECKVFVSTFSAYQCFCGLIILHCLRAELFMFYNNLIEADGFTIIKYQQIKYLKITDTDLTQVKYII